MSRIELTVPGGSPPRPPPDIQQRSLPLHLVGTGIALYRIHRTRLPPLRFGRERDPVRRRRWDAPDASYGVCHVAFASHIAFVETLLRDLSLDTVHQHDVAGRSLAFVQVRSPLRLVDMNDRHLRRLAADASAVHGDYGVTWDWSAAVHAHRERPDGIRYRARHDDSGFSAAVFGRARRKVGLLRSVPLNDPSLAAELAGWLDRYDIGLT